MKKIAIFVEGYSELLFIDKLFSEMCAEKHLAVSHRQIRGGSTCPLKILEIKASDPSVDHQYFLTILDCGSDKQVKSRIYENYDSMAKSGYCKIIGLRDKGPDFFTESYDEALVKIKKYIKQKPLPVIFVLATMGLEAWYLADAAHFERAHPDLTISRIKTDLGIDLASIDVESIPDPHNLLKSIYDLEKLNIDKPWTETVKIIDYAEVWMNFSKIFRSLGELMAEINDFFEIKTA